ncbi:MAG TPA: hypothetical protein VJ204_04635 [Solirubrobacterales bacterium]|nr:hypothetical protein [Solirubrobacterales bacterium]
MDAPLAELPRQRRPMGAVALVELALHLVDPLLEALQLALGDLRLLGRRGAASGRPGERSAALGRQFHPHAQRRGGESSVPASASTATSSLNGDPATAVSGGVAVTVTGSSSAAPGRARERDQHAPALP